MATYFDEREKEALLLALGLFKDKTTRDYYNAIFDCNYQQLNDFFGVASKSEAKVLAKILYAVDALNLRNNLVFEVYDENSISEIELYNLVGYGYKVDIFKIILKDMIYYTLEHGEFDVCENLTLFNIIKALMVSEVYCNESESTENYSHDDSFASDINFLENKYIEFLSLHYNIDIYDLRNMEDNEISWVVLYINSLCRGHFSDTDTETVKKAKSVIEKFPMLKQILSINTAYSNDYTEFMEENGMSLTLNKSDS